MNYSEILKNAREDPDLLSQIDIGELLSSIDTIHPYFENKTLDDISADIFDVLSECSEIDVEEREKICGRLTEYYHVGQIYQFQKGRYIRWLRKTGGSKLTNGGVVMDVIFREQGGTYILCMTNQRRPCQLRFDDCIFFQKLTEEEQLVLAVMAHCHTD